MGRSVVGAAILCCTVLYGCHDPVGDVLAPMHLVEILPPTSLPVPGTIIFTEGKDYSEVHQACTLKDAYGVTSPTPHEVPTETQDFKSATSASMDVSAQYSNVLNASVSGKYVDSVTLHFSNAHVLEVAQSEIENATLTGVVSAGCLSAIKHDLAVGRKLAIISRAVVADATYTITYNANATADIQAKISQNLAANLHGDVTIDSSQTVSGTGLIWGIYADEVLFSSYMDDVNGVHKTSIAMNNPLKAIRSNSLKSKKPLMFVPAQ